MTPVIAPKSQQEARRLVAGLCALSRILIELDRAGVVRAVVALAPDAWLRAAVDDDLRRSHAALEVVWADPAEAAERVDGPLAVIGCGAIIRADAMPALLAAGKAMTWRGGVLAAPLADHPPGVPVRLPDAVDAAGALELGDSEVIVLDQRGASRAVLRGASKASDGIVSRRINRPISRALSAWVLRRGPVRPDHLTLVTLAVAILMFVALVGGGPAGLLVGCLLLQAASVVDGVDGEVARATYRSSPAGAALDTAVDVATTLMFALGITIGEWRLHGLAPLLAGGFAFGGFGLGVGAMSWLIRRGPGGGSFDVLKVFYAQRLPGRTGGRIVAVVRTVTSRDFFALAFAVLGVCGLDQAIPWLLAGGVAVWLAVIAFAAPMLLLAERGSLQPEHLKPDDARATLQA